MSKYEFPQPIADLVQRQIGSGRYDHEDQVLLAALRSLDAEEVEWRAIDEALVTLEQGNPGVSLNDAFAEVRRRHAAVTES